MTASNESPQLLVHHHSFVVGHISQLKVLVTSILCQLCRMFICVFEQVSNLVSECHECCINYKSVADLESEEMALLDPHLLTMNGLQTGQNTAGTHYFCVCLYTELSLRTHL